MTKEELKEVNDINEKMLRLERELGNIDSLLSCCGLNCVISGTPKGKFNRKVEFSSVDKERIKGLLTFERDRIKSELDSLMFRFGSISIEKKEIEKLY